MPNVGINLNEVVEKPRLPGGQPFTFHFKKSELGLSKNPNKKTGKQEGLISCIIQPLEADWNDRDVYHTFSLSPGALQSDDAVISIKKFFTTVGFQWGPNGEFSNEDLYSIKFVGEIKYEEGNNFPRLAKVVQGVA